MFNEVDNPNKRNNSENTDGNRTEPNSDKQYKNIETSVNNRDYFDEDYASSEKVRKSNEETAPGKDKRAGA